jgi:Ca2+:H+ antiporter
MSQASSIRIHGVLKMGKKLIAYIKKKPIVILLLAIPFAIIAKFGGWDPLSVFIFAALGVIPLAGYIGEATEAFAYYTGPRIGGLLNATLGNAAELIITIVAIREGLLDLVKASITGSILGNLLLVLGTAMFLGGLRHGIQKFDQRKASHDAVLLVLTVLILMIPSLFGHNIEVGPEGSVKIEVLSLGVAAVMMIIYILGLVFSMKKSFCLAFENCTGCSCRFNCGCGLPFGVICGCCRAGGRKTGDIGIFHRDHFYPDHW